MPYTGTWNNKKVNILGDSVTAGYGLEDPSRESFGNLIKEKLGLSIVRNYGYSGTLLAKLEGFENSFVERYETMDDDADLIIVFGGINDFGFGAGLLGRPNSEDVTTVSGALNELITGLQSNYLGKEIVFITPYNLIWGGLSSDLANTAGYTLKDYRDVILERCEYHGVPVIDMYSISGMNIAHNKDHQSLYAPDGVHLNREGHSKFADRIASFLNNNL